MLLQWFRRQRQSLHTKSLAVAKRRPRFELLEERSLLSVTPGIQNESLRADAARAVDARALLGWTAEPIDLGNGIFFLASGADPLRVDVLNNANAADTTNTDQLYTGGGLNLNLTGAGVTVGVWEAFESSGVPGIPASAMIRDTHQEFTGRVTVIDAPPAGAVPLNHATHVAGTIAAVGDDSAAQGMAGEVAIRNRDANADLAELASDATNGLIDLSNHSYGAAEGWTTAFDWGIGPVDTWNDDRFAYAVEDPSFGKYSTLTQDLDDTLSSNPNLLSVWSAGNDRGETFTDQHGDGKYVTKFSQDPGGIDFQGSGWYLVPASGNSGTTAPSTDGGAAGYDILPDKQTAKNNLVVGAIEDILNVDGPYDPANPPTVTMTAFSSWGPTDDGRIKPDVVANGDNLKSSWGTADDAYATISGTSMAAPNVTGTAALLVEHYRNLFGDGNLDTNSYPNLFDDDNPRSATTKGLLIHTAFDVTTGVATVGPDYSTGWGLVAAAAAAAAAEFLTEAEQGSGSTDHLFERAYDGNTWEFNVNSDGTERLRVTIVWTDPAPLTATLPGSGLDDSTKVLVNDLDLWVTNSSGTVFYRAWNLDPAELVSVRKVLWMGF